MVLKFSRRIALFILVSVVGVLTGGYWWLSYGQYQESTDNAYIRADKTLVSSKLPGFLETGWINDNQRVSEGTVLARIEVDDYRNNREKAQASLDSAKASLNSIVAQTALQHSLIRQAGAAIEADQSALQQAEDDVHRFIRLSRSGYSSQRDLESARVSEDSARARLDQALANLDSQSKQLGVLAAQKQQAEASLASARAALGKADSDLEKVMIRAPEDSIVAQRMVQSGEFVNAGTALFSLMELDTVWIVANFKETQISRIKVGQPVAIEIDSFPGSELTGYIDSFAPGSGAEFSILPPQNATGNFTKIVQRIPVKIVIPQGNELSGRLRPGMSVEVHVNTLDQAVDLSQLQTRNNNSSADPAERAEVEQAVVVAHG